MYLISLSLISQGETKVREEGGGAALCSAGWGWGFSVETMSSGYTHSPTPQYHTSTGRKWKASHWLRVAIKNFKDKYRWCIVVGKISAFLILRKLNLFKQLKTR